MAPRKIVLDAATVTRLIEVRHALPRGLSVSRYLLARAGESEPDRFTTLRKARAAFQEQIAGLRCSDPAGTQDA